MQYYPKKLDSSPLRGEKNLPVSQFFSLKSSKNFSLQDPFREAKLLAVDAIRHGVETIDYTTDPSLNVPDKYKHMVWFALPIDIALMIFKVNQTGQESNCDLNSIPFMPDDAKVSFQRIHGLIIFLLLKFQARILNAEKNKSSAHRKKVDSSNRHSLPARVR
jgi:hypothetical protein